MSAQPKEHQPPQASSQPAAKPQPAPAQNKRSMWHLVTGGVAGGVSRTVTNPLERLKILRQLGTPEYANMSVLKAMIKFGQLEGFKGFFKGNGSNCLKIIPFSAIEFWTFEVAKSHFLTGDQKTNSKIPLLLCGSLAGINATIWTYPMDLIRTYLSINVNQQNAGMFGELRKVYMNQGVQGLFRGMGLSLVGIAPFIGLKMASFDLLKERYLPDRSHPYFTSINLTIGGAAGAIATTFTYPIDVLRRKLQMIAFSPDPSKLPYNGLVSCIQYVNATEGYQGFFKGLVPCYLKVVPAIAIMFAVNEKLKQWLGVASV